MWTDIIHIAWPYIVLIAVICGAAPVAPELDQEGKR